MEYQNATVLKVLPLPIFTIGILLLLLQLGLQGSVRVTILILGSLCVVYAVYAKYFIVKNQTPPYTKSTNWHLLQVIFIIITALFSIASFNDAKSAFCSAQYLSTSNILEASRASCISGVVVQLAVTVGGFIVIYVSVRALTTFVKKKAIRTNL